MRITNNSTGVAIRSAAIAEMNGEDVIVWLEIAPQHPKLVGAIWASLVNGTGERLTIRTDDNEIVRARGLNRRYHKLTMDAPRLAGRARPVFMRLIAPSALRVDKDADFIVLEWPGRTLGQMLAAMLEQATHYPIQIGWGDYLLYEAVRREDAVPLRTFGPAPQGYYVSGKTPWGALISDGLKHSYITLDGQVTVELPALAPICDDDETCSFVSEDDLIAVL